jgi:hypothetical protein
MIMNYELAKELREAGFEQKPFNGRADKEGNWVYTPTLSELIEACGEGFETLSRDTTSPDSSVCWIANNYHDADAPEEKILGWYEGPTPDIAVARLWLALNKQK